MKDRILNALMLVTVGLALILSYFHGQDAPSPLPAAALQIHPSPLPSPSPPPIRQYLLQRNQQRQEERLALQTILENENMDAAFRTRAGNQLLEITENAEAELALEAALAAKGMEGVCIVRKGKITLFVDQPLDEASAALLIHLAAETTGVHPENIRLSIC
ncbi:MAG: SpoIIIAH-like family protein [Clostridia bacterium]|nr:SpoIIIAH-like family protein [Clostridia bacterium]